MLEQVVVKENIHEHHNFCMSHFAFHNRLFTLTLKTAVISQVVAEILSWHTFLVCVWCVCNTLGLW